MDTGWTRCWWKRGRKPDASSARNRRWRALTRARHVNQRAGATGLGVDRSSDKTRDAQTANDLVLEDGVHVVPHVEFAGRAGHVKLKLALRSIVQRLDSLAASALRYGLGDPVTHVAFSRFVGRQRPIVP